MSFDYEHTVTTSASPADVWALWSDVGSWHRWDPAVEQVAIEGHFGEGAAGTIAFGNGTEAPFVLEIVEPCARYLDKLTFGDLVIRIDHQVKETADGAEITVRTTVEGPGAQEVGPTVVEDTPHALEALVNMAEKRS
jgi:polyketide cyclase/dehydrase/lipid transport protein